MEEMFPRPSEPYLQPQKQSAWLEKARLTVQGDKKIEPFNFKPQVSDGHHLLFGTDPRFNSLASN